MTAKKGLLEVLAAAIRLVDQGIPEDEALAAVGWDEAIAAASAEERKEAKRLVKEAAARHERLGAINIRLADWMAAAAELMTRYGARRVEDLQRVAPAEFLVWEARGQVIVKEIEAAGLDLEQFGMRKGPHGLEMHIG